MDEDAKMDAGRVSKAMTEYLSQLSIASAVHSLNQQLLQSVFAVCSDSFIGNMMGTLNAKMALKSRFHVRKFI